MEMVEDHDRFLGSSPSTSDELQGQIPAPLLINLESFLLTKNRSIQTMGHQNKLCLMENPEFY